MMIVPKEVLCYILGFLVGGGLATSIVLTSYGSLDWNVGIGAFAFVGFLCLAFMALTGIDRLDALEKERARRR